jgi:hypothetical protein
MGHNNTLKLGLSDRHEMPVDEYLIGTIGHRACGYDAAYNTVMLWRESGKFIGYQHIELYYSGHIGLVVGALDAFEALHIPVTLMQFDKFKNEYHPIRRTR